MNYNNVLIQASSQYLPEKHLSSDDIEYHLKDVYQKLKLPFGRLELMTGIQRRGYWEPGTRPSDLSTNAANILLEENSIDPQEIDLVIHCSVCRDFLEPATASVIHSNLNLRKDCLMFDLSNACLGVLNAVIIASNMIESGLIKKALLVSGENSGPLLWDTINHLKKDQTLTRKTIKKYLANFTIGSAGSAWLLSHKEQGDGHQIMGGAQLTDSTANHLCQGGGNTNSLMMETDATKLLEVGLKLAKETWHLMLKNLNQSAFHFDYFVPHQVGRAHEQGLSQALEIDQKKIISTFPFMGNTGSAAVPTAFDHLIRSKEISGKQVALLGIGSGLSSIMLGVKCR
ncbi:MAG: 3-oxoacyl-ACP synthase III [Bdellovibrionales bacterium]|jgi:3-oxoacyl-[acyl-carrier-protein] synthase III|nr:3-oxoacyl-ACP synthase III [Bdellovibrionales bacterium]